MLSQTKTQYSTVSASPHRPVVRVPEAEKVASAVVDEPRLRKDLVDKLRTRMASYLEMKLCSWCTRRISNLQILRRSGYSDPDQVPYH